MKINPDYLQDAMKLQVSLQKIIKFQCPFCKGQVYNDDFIQSMRRLEHVAEPVYEVIYLCRTCRDSGL